MRSTAHTPIFASTARAQWPRRALRLAARTALAAVALTVVLLATGAIYLLTLPGVGGAPARARQLLADHGESVTVLPTPRRLVDAVIATEDEHFDGNIILNVLSGAGRAALVTVQGGANAGGSTIDQQLAKALYGDTGGLFGTLRQIGLGVKLALGYTHHQLLAMYLNVNYYGQGLWGVTQAARGYFGTVPSRLSWAEASMLGGLLQAPSAYDPLTDYPLAKERQQHVLNQLVANGYLTEMQSDAAYAARLPLR